MSSHVNSIENKFVQLLSLKLKVKSETQETLKRSTMYFLRHQGNMRAEGAFEANPSTYRRRVSRTNRSRTVSVHCMVC